MIWRYIAPEQGTVQIPTRTPATSIPASPPRSIAFCIRPWVPPGAIMDGPTPGRNTSLSIHSAMPSAMIEAIRATRWSRPIQPRKREQPEADDEVGDEHCTDVERSRSKSRRRASVVGVPFAVTALTRVSVKVANSTRRANAHGLKPSRKPAAMTVGIVSPPKAAESNGTAST